MTKHLLQMVGVGVLLAVLTVGCAISSSTGDSQAKPGSPQGEERERMEKMLNPSPNE